MKKLLFILSVITLSFNTSAQNNYSQKIDSIFSQFNKPNTPGCAVGVIKDGQLIFVKGYGVANLEYNIPITPNTIFRICSTSKQFTAASILRLAEQNKLHLNDKLSKFFPAFPEYANSITIQHLINHTSGLKDYLDLVHLKGYSDDYYYEDKEVEKWLINQKTLNFTPGDQFQYSNSGYWLLAQIIEKVAKMNLADFAQQQFFEPLGMTDTHFHNNNKRIVKNRAYGYSPNNEEGYETNTTQLNIIGDGGLFTTINDLKKWDDAFYHNMVMNTAFKELMIKQGVLNNGNKISYASGLSVSEVNDIKIVSHAGSFVGYNAELIRVPKERFSVIVLSNRADVNPTVLSVRIMRIFLKDTFSSHKKKKKLKNYPSIQLPSKQLSNYAGNYWNKKEEYTIKISVKNDTLRFQQDDGNIKSLLPIARNKFIEKGKKRSAIYEFNKIENNKPELNIFSKNDEHIQCFFYEPKNYKTKELKPLEGRYYSQELNVNYTIKLENKELLLYIDGDKKSALKPIMNNLFKNDDFGFFYFDETDKKVISGFKLNFLSAKNIAFKKL
ncbi:serine hydrolase [Prolixibacteraceae bacterium JC049]|nr:serine hydrolase [Prolixibacteraceae bacterium JC049]